MKKKELSIEQKKADKDLNIIIYATLIPLIIYLIFGNDIMNFAKTSEMNIWLRFIPVMLVQFSLAGLGSLIVICYRKEELKEYDVNMFLLEVERIEAQLKEVEGKYHIADEESKEASQSYENIKSEYEKLEQDMASMDDKIASMREEMSQSTVTKGKLEGQINVLNEQIHTAEMTDEHLKSRLDSIDREKQERIESRGTYEAEKQELDTELAAAATEKETAAEQLRNIQEEIARCTEGIEKGKNEIIELLNRKASVKARQQRYDTMMEQAPDTTKVTFTFRDNSKVILTMVDQFGQGWLPQDWTDGKNAADRSAADLAQQYARGLLHKSGQYIYPILTPEKQQEFISQQYEMTGGTQWTWKFGSSSPSVRDYVLVPTDDDSAYRIICRMDGGGIGDVRTGYLVQTTCEDGGRRMISDVTELSDADMTQSELFRLYYSTGLALPSLPDEVGNFSGLPRTDSLTAAQDAFYYFGSPVDGSKTGWIADVTQIQSIVRSDIRGGAYIDIVQLTFTDGSDPINVQMEQTGTGYWKPTGIQEDVSAMSGANVLPVSADAFGALSFANLPTLNTGDIIIFNFGSKPVDGVTLVNRLVNAAGSPRYQNMTDDETTLTRTNSGYVYTIPQSVSELLASDLSVPFYHALTLEYTDAQHIRHTAVTAYMTNAMTQLENPPLPSGGYYSDALGCILKLPQEFRNAVSANINTDGTTTFFVKDTDSVLMTLTAQLLSVLKRDFGENWAENYPVPIRPLAEQDGLAYFLIYPSDVQYDPADEQAAAQYERRNMEDTEHYGDRTTAELLLYLPISDGAYTEGILATLDARYREDKAAFEQALRAADSTAQSLWAQHLAAQ